MDRAPDEALAARVRRELLDDILPFWRRRSVDSQQGGFIGLLSNDLRLDASAPKGLILNARILWTFSAAARYTADPEDVALARRAYEYLSRHFADPEHGGYYWAVDAAGAALDPTKKIYGQAFCVYALAEYYATFQEPASLEQAIEGFHRIEAHSHDDQHGGYFEALSRAWQPLADMRLSEKDLNEKKSMNNHLHVLEAYGRLFHFWPDAILERRLRELIELFHTRILNPQGTHFQHFFDDTWTPRSDSYTFGHDIEGSWLLCEAAEALGDETLLRAIGAVAIHMARAVLVEGQDDDGGLFYEGRGGHIIDSHKEWWPQAEAVVGFYHAYQLTGEEAFRNAAARCWQFIEDRLVDREHGEWFWRVDREGRPDMSLPKVSTWKCPYHNGRCCLEILRRTRKSEPDHE